LSKVLPAAEFAPHIKKRGGTVAIFNLEPSKWDSEADFLFLGNCAETLPDALDVKDVISQLGLL
jgi:NAD-dependent deacetylase sirtuin 5